MANRFEELFNNVDVGLYRSTLGGKLLEVNPMLVRLSGLSSKDEVLKHNIIDLYPNPEDRKLVIEKIKKHGFVKLYSFPMQNFVGRRLSVNVSVTLVRGDNGEIYLDGALQDVTDLETAKTELIFSEKKYHDLVENINLPVFVSTPGPVGKFIEANEAAVRVLGADSKEDLLTRKPSDLYADPEGRKMVSDEVVKRGFIKDRELELINYKGKKINIITSVILKTGPSGQFLYGSFFDITERKAIEDKLRANELILKKSQEVAKVGSWILDSETGKISGSEEAFKIFGVEKSDDIDMRRLIIESAHPADKEKVLAAMAGAFQGKVPGKIEYRVVWPDESLHYVFAIPAESIFDASGKIVRISGIVQDITDRKKIELDLLEKISELERMNNLMINRELKMIELKEEIAKLKQPQSK